MKLYIKFHFNPLIGFEEPSVELNKHYELGARIMNTSEYSKYLLNEGLRSTYNMSLQSGY